MTSKVPLNGHGLRVYAAANGYLKISVSQQKLGIGYVSMDSTYGVGVDTVVVDLKTHLISKVGRRDVDGLA